MISPIYPETSHDSLFTFFISLNLSMLDPTDNLNQLIKILKQLQLENDNLQKSLWKLQDWTPMELEEKKINSPSTSINIQPIETNPPSTLTPTNFHPSMGIEPKVSLPDKFDGTRSRFWGFINNMK